MANRERSRTTCDDAPESISQSVAGLRLDEARKAKVAVSIILAGAVTSLAILAMAGLSLEWQWGHMWPFLPQW